MNTSWLNLKYQYRFQIKKKELNCLNILSFFVSSLYPSTIIKKKRTCKDNETERNKIAVTPKKTFGSWKVDE